MESFVDTSFDVVAYQDANSPFSQPEHHPYTVEYLESVPPHQRVAALYQLQAVNSKKQLEDRAQRALVNSRINSGVVLPRPFNGQHIHVTEGTLLHLKQ